MAEAERLPPSWRPRHGEVLSGFISDRIERDSQYREGELVTVLIIDQLDSAVSVWCSPKALQTLLSEHDPQPGDLLTLRFDGEIPTKKGFLAKTYSMRLEKGARA